MKYIKKRMKNKITLITLLMIIMLPVTLYAEYTGFNTDAAIGETQTIRSSIEVTNRVTGVLQVVGSVISVIALIIIGIRYMLSSVQDRAEMKGVLGYYIVGCVLVFSTSNILSIVSNSMDSVTHVYGELYDITRATCVSVGTGKRKCIGSLCNCTRNNKSIIIEVVEEITPDIHTWDVNGGEGWFEDVATTCESDGVLKRVCIHCGKTERDRNYSNGHDYEDYIIKSATCSEERRKR